MDPTNYALIVRDSQTNKVLEQWFSSPSKICMNIDAMRLESRGDEWRLTVDDIFNIELGRVLSVGYLPANVIVSGIFGSGRVLGHCNIAVCRVMTVIYRGGGYRLVGSPNIEQIVIRDNEYNEFIVGRMKVSIQFYQ